ncbi:glutamate receptor U1 [Leptinotarsa decemlineata]|uniref:glutamate receptor U1 n=1 Tax=Leptinotarsa decemlineata TaxID=7539 RepID=UPI003D308B95
MPFQENVFMTSNESCNPESGSINVDMTCLLQVYKIRKSNNSSLVVCPLGIWGSNTGTKNLNLFMDIEKRGNFHDKYPLIFGNKDLNKVLGQEDPSEDDEESDEMNEFTTYFTTFLNARKTVLHFPRFGKKDETGEWTDLLGAIVKGEIDISSECMSKNLERFNDMSFTHDVLTTTKNIYIQPEESSEFRDIFLVPFDNRLIIAVLSTGLIFSLIMTLSNKISSIMKTDEIHAQNKGVLDSIVWCIGIFSQQGTLWKPTLYGGRIVVLISLAFTLLIYNSYSAFITSVLSVELSSIRNVDDLLQSDYEIGYTKNSQDEVYLRSMNISQLNHIYLRGYLENDVNNISEGLMRVTRGSYGFFASSHLARKQLLNISNYRCRFKIDEIPIRYTVDHMAFVTAKKSSYRKLINLSIIKMYETGVYKYIHNHIHPDLPKCDKKKMYQSARLVDLTTAFVILILGHVGSVIFLIAECIWNRKRNIPRYFRNKVSNSQSRTVQQGFVL